MGILGTLFYELDHKKQYYPTRRDEEARDTDGFASHRVENGQHRTAVYMRRTASRSGIGSTLPRLAEGNAVALGAGSIHVDASLAAVEFYKANGFEVIAQGAHQLWQPM